LALGNGLVGNPPDTAALEITLAGPRVRAECELACVLFGAPFPILSDRRRLSSGTTFTLGPGEELSIAATPRGMRGYFCVAGGLGGKTVLHSKSSLDALVVGTELACACGMIASRFIRPTPHWNRDPYTLRVLDGPQADWFQPNAICDQPFRISEESNRMGLRLEGEPVLVPDRELTSEPVSPGAVQVTANSQCIVLGVDGQTIGGYPKIAQVISADLDKLGQLRPGDRIRFRRVSLEDAEIIYRQKQLELCEWLARLRTTFPPATVVGRIDADTKDPER
jgi:antagonist of KipI